MSSPEIRIDSRLLINSVSTFALNGSTLKLGGFFLAPKSGNISHIFLPVSSLAGTSPFYEGRIESMTSGSANPSGSLFGTNTNVATQAGASNTGAWYALTSPAAVTAGNAFAAIWAYSSGTIGAGNAATVLVGSAAVGLNQPYFGTFNGASWSMTTGVPAIAVRYDDGTILQESLPISQHQLGGGYSSGSSPNERALAFTPPVDKDLVGIRGIGVIGDLTNSTVSVNVYLGTSTTPLATWTTSRPMATSTGIGVPFSWPFPAVPVSGGKEYRLSIKATGSGTITLYRITFPSTAERDAVVGPCYLSTRAGGAWTDSPTNLDIIIPVFSTATTRNDIGFDLNGGFVD